MLQYFLYLAALICPSCLAAEVYPHCTMHTFTPARNHHYRTRKACFPRCFCMPVLVFTAVILLTSLTLRKWVFFGHIIGLNRLVKVKEDGRVQHLVQLACLSWRLHLQWLQSMVQNLRCLSELEQWSRKLLSGVEIAIVKRKQTMTLFPCW